MKVKITFLVLIILGVLEIFLDFFTVLINNILLSKNENYKMDEKKKTHIKIFFIIIFFVGVVYFLGQFVKVMANLFGISLEKGIFDIFK